jgi:uncharacterized membrane protein
VISEENLHEVVDVFVRLVELAGAVIIFGGVVMAVVRLLGVAVTARRRSSDSFVPIRLDLGRFLALGLEFQLASDLLSTAVAPTFEEIGKLAAVAAIRTALNFFLAREIREEREEVEQDRERRR